MRDKYYFHHPFKKSSFGIFVFPNSDNASQIESSGFLLEEIDLYYQPLEHPIVAISLFGIKLFFIIIGMILCSKVLGMVKKEPSIDSQLLEIFCWIQIIFQPILVFFDLTVNLIHPIDDIIGPWFCSLGWLFYSVSTKFILNHSFFTAMMRYVFILHNDIVNKFGKQKFKRYFLYLSISACMFGVLVDGIDNKELSRLSFINKCYGNDHKVFLIESSTFNVLRRKFWEVESNAIDNYVGTWEHIYLILLKLMKLVKTSIFLITGFNVAEGILYFTLFSDMKR